MEELDNVDINYNIENIVKKLEDETEVKFKLVNEIDLEYVALGQITEEDLIESGFRFIGYSSYVKCPIYRYGKNIEAIFNETILDVYTI